MSNQDQNWQNLFGDYTTGRTPWYGKWVTYAANQKVVKSQRVIRSFQMNTDNSVVTHTNRYLDDNNSIIDEKHWQISREDGNLPDGVVHPAMPWLRALSPQTGTAAWLSPQLIPGKVFGAELIFRDGNWRSSAVIAYGANGQLDRIVHIREHLGCFFERSLITEPMELTGNWLAEQYHMTANLHISFVEKTQICFAPFRDDCKLLSLPEGMSLILPKMVTADQPFQISAVQQTIDQKLKFSTVRYTAIGKFLHLTFARLQQQVQDVSEYLSRAKNCEKVICNY